MKVVYRDVEIVVEEGDITKFEVDAIVNPANSLMVMGGGVAGAIKRVGGKEIEEEAKRHAPVPIGEAIVTSAGRLKAKYIIHAPTMKRPAGITNLDHVSKSVIAALKKASNLKLRSIAFPGMGTGIGGLNIYESVRTMLKNIRTHIISGTSLRKIILVAYGKAAYEEFLRALKDEFSNGKH